MKDINKIKPDYLSPLILVTTLFFMWGFVTNLNGILVPHLQRACNLSANETKLINFVFFGAYFLVSIPAGIVIKNVGTKNGLILGLIICAIGAASFYPAAMQRSFIFYLLALSILAAGITFLQVGANPYALHLGKSKTAPQRLVLLQAFNSSGAALAPYIGSMILFNPTALTGEEYEMLKPTMSKAQILSYQLQEAEVVKYPYILLALFILIIALLLWRAYLPEVGITSKTQSFYKSLMTVFKRKRTVYSAICIFFYVGAEVGLASLLAMYINHEEFDILPIYYKRSIVSYYMFLAMIGRFLGAYLMYKIPSGKLLILCVGGAVLFSAASTIVPTNIAVLLLVFIGLFNSIMFPTVFSWGMKGLGNHTIAGSSIQIMAIVGGAIIPFFIQGELSSHGIVLGAYLVILFFVYKIIRQANKELKRSI